MFTQRNWFCLFLAMFVSVGLIQNAGLSQDDVPGFYATVQERFSRWDSNKDGVLSYSEIVSAFQSPNCRGRGAAAIAVLNQRETGHLMKKEPLESFTLDKFNKMEAEAKGKDEKNQKKYESCLKRINSRSKVLYEHALPQIDGASQHKSNDCWFLSVVASLSRQRPKDLMKLIEDDNNGKYTIRFVGEAPITIACVSDAELASYTSSDDGLWLPILMKAYGKLELKKKWNNIEATPTHEDPLEAMAIHGGNCGRAVRFMSGHAVKSKKPKEIAGSIRKQIASAFDEHRMVMVGVPGHALAAMSYDRNSDQLQIWNPWGNTGLYRELDVKMQNGFFTMPVSEFVEKCTNIMFELAENAPPEQNGKKKNGKKKQGGR